MKFLFLFLGLVSLGLINIGISLLIVPTEEDVRPAVGNFSFIKPTPSPLIQPEVVLPMDKYLDSGRHMFQTFNNCGPAALSMTLSHFDFDLSQDEIGQALRSWQNPGGDNDDKSVTLAEMSLLAQEYGFITYHRPAGDIKLLKNLVANDLPVIVRTWLRTDEDIGHYRVVVGYDDLAQVIIQDDSLQGKGLKYSYSDFEALWQAFNNEFLVIVPKSQQDQVENILADLSQPNLAWKKALEAANSQLIQDPNDFYANFNQVVAFTNLGRYSEAVVVFNQIKNRLPSRMLWYQIEPLLALYKTGDHKQVLELSNAILNNGNQAFSELHQLQSMIYLDKNQSELALDAKNKANTYGSNKQYWQINLEI